MKDRRAFYKALTIVDGESSDRMVLVKGNKNCRNYERIDFDSRYDIKTPDGEVFEGCKIYFRYVHSGSEHGELCPVPRFVHKSLDGKLTEAFLVRMNAKSVEKKAREEEKEKRRKLRELYQDRRDLDRGIKKLGSKRS